MNNDMFYSTDYCMTYWYNRKPDVCIIQKETFSKYQEFTEGI